MYGRRSHDSASVIPWRRGDPERDSEAGITLVELGVGMVITALLSTVMITWIFTGFSAESTHRSYDQALEDLRNVSDQLSREVRAADYLTASDTASMTFWLDGNRDGIVDTGETVTWAIEAGGVVVRVTDDGNPKTVVATRLSPTGSSFSYDAAMPGDVGRVTIDLIALAATSAGGDEVFLSTDIYLRNA
jgi:type II secretory pathway pseudopilin PulG